MIDPFSLPRLHPIADPPPPQTDWALFLDLDGTLLDIASRPDRVIVPRSLPTDLALAMNALGGALAIVTGRTLMDLDRLLAPLRLPGAAEHGAVVRYPSGECNTLSSQIPDDWLTELNALASHLPGVQVELKSKSVAVHFRRARKQEGRLRAFCETLARSSPTFEVLGGKMVFEIRAREANKGRAVNILMAHPPFQGRTPVFIGDDITDQDGFAAATAMGGRGLDVPTYFAGLPREVRLWLRSVARMRAE